MSMAKHIKRSSTVGWCPLAHGAPLLASGTAAGTISDFGNSAPQLELFTMTTSDAQDRTMPVLGSMEVNERFHCMSWGKGDFGTPYGVIAGGMANGTVMLCNPAVLVKGDKDGCILSLTEKHSGPVQGIDFNPSQPNLLATGGAESEVFIWDIVSPTTPKNYTPGAKVQQQTDITCLQWNPKVPYILSSAAYNGVVVIWDLRAKKPVITFSDPSRKTKCRSLAWNPIEPMQIVTASEEDTSPVIQVWDLRNTYSPSKYLEGHTKGIWSMSWCPVDPGLLLSCSKHNEIFCWNMQTGRIQCEIETTNSWNSNVQWAPHLPSIFSVCSLEGQVKVFCLQDPTPRVLGGGSTKHVDFSHPPKWLKKPVGASFGFGGKLFSFNQTSSAVNVRTLVTDPEFISRADRLERAIESGSFKAFCEEKVQEATQTRDKQMWNLMKVLFETDARSRLLAELEYGPEAIKQHIAEVLANIPDQSGEGDKPGSPPTSQGKDKEKEKEDEKVEAREPVHDNFAEQEEKKELDDSAKEEAIPFGNSGEKGEDVSELFGGGAASSHFNIGTATEGQDDLFANFGGSQPVDDPFAAIAAAQRAVPEAAPGQPITTHERAELAQKLVDPIDFDTSNSEDTVSLITRALIVGNFSLAVDICVKTGRMADALVLAACGGPELWAKTQDRYFNQNRAPFMRLISSIVKDKLQDLVAQTKLVSWKGTLAVLCTYAKSDEFPVLCDFLGKRLEEAGDSDSAILCYMCAGNIEKTVSAWAKQVGSDRNQKQGEGATALVDLLEKVNIFRRAIDYNDITDVLAAKYSQYAEALAAQGQLAAAMKYLSFLSDPKFNTLTGRDGAVLLDRVYHALGSHGQAPPFPFAQEDVRADQRLTYGQQPVQQPQPTQPTTQFPSHPSYGGHTAVTTQPSHLQGGQPPYGGQTQPVNTGGRPSASSMGGHSAHMGGGGGVGVGGGQPSYLDRQAASHGAQPPSPFGGAAPSPSHFGGAAPVPSHFGESAQPPSRFGGAAPSPSHFGGAAPGPSHFGGASAPPPSAFGGAAPAPSHFGSGGGGQPSQFPPGPSHFGGSATLPPPGGSGGLHSPQPAFGAGSFAGSVSGGPPAPSSHGAQPPSPFGGAAPAPSRFDNRPTPAATSPSTVSTLEQITPEPPTSKERQPVEKGPSLQSNTHLKTKEEKPAGSGQPTAVGTQALNKYAALIDTFSVQFSGDPRKSKYIVDAKGRLEPLFGKLRNGELSAGAEGVLLELANCLEKGDKNTAHALHKDAAGKYWEELSSAPMIGMKRLIDIL